ncbi:MAG: hypothetical protein VX278_17070 [Myxococcota bacterium]|nr:hypothetical protein [Myxococcota bacterium]
MSDLRICFIETAAMERAKQEKYRPIYVLLRQYGLEKPPGDLRSLPRALQQVYKWARIESLNVEWSRYYRFIGVSPFFIVSFANQAYPILWFLLPFSIPIALIAVALLVLTKTGWIRGRLSLFESPFVALVGATLIENLPDLRELVLEKDKIQQQVRSAQRKVVEIDSVERKLIEKSRSLGEDSSHLVQTLQEERAAMVEYQEQAQQLLSDIQEQMRHLELIRQKVRQRAELEVIRNQARVLSLEESEQFSQRALADLEVNTIDLRHRIAQFREQMVNQELLFKGENELSRHPIN